MQKVPFPDFSEKLSVAKVGSGGRKEENGCIAGGGCNCTVVNEWIRRASKRRDVTGMAASNWIWCSEPESGGIRSRRSTGHRQEQNKTPQAAAGWTEGNSALFTQKGDSLPCLQPLPLLFSFPAKNGLQIQASS